MVKSPKTAKRKWNKRGAALAYTLIATMVLMILSTSLFTAAGYNISLTTKNDNARQSYITCKSAVEYAKGHILQQAQTAKAANMNVEEDKSSAEPANALSVANTIKGTMAGFNVEPNSTSESGFKIAPLDDTTTPAKCYTELKSVTQTLVQAVTTCQMNSTNSYTVKVQSQTITNTMDPNELSKPLTEISKDTNDTQTKNTTVSVANKTEILFVRYVFTYHIKIAGASQYSTSDTRSQQLNYETDCTIGGSDKDVTLTPPAVEVPIGTQHNPGTKMIGIDGTYGGVCYTNGDYLRPPFGWLAGWNYWYYWSNPWSYHWMHPWIIPDGISKLPLVFKNTIKSSGNSGYLNAPAIYFMNSKSFSVEDTLPIFTGNQYDYCSVLDSDFIYFNGEIDGLQYVGDSYHIYRSMLKLVNSRNSLKLSNGYDGIVQFNKTIIQIQSKDNYGRITILQKNLDGLYYFKNYTDLFDFSGLDTKLRTVPPEDYPKIRSVADQDYVDYLKLNIDPANGINNILSADSRSGDGISWVQNGNISDGKPSDQKDKTVYCYVDRCDTWGNTLSNYPNTAYGAKNIIFEWAGDYPFTVPDGKTATFQADYLNLNTNGEPIQSFKDSNSKFIVKSVSADTNTLTMVFTQDTPIQYYDYYYFYGYHYYPFYTIKAGTYTGVPSGLNLFSKEASDFFADPANMTATSAFQKTNQPQTAVPDFLLYGLGYGGNSGVITSADSPQFVSENSGKGTSNYPVLFNQPVKMTSTQVGFLKAPQLYFMGEGESITDNGSDSVNLNSNFIYIAGNKLTGSHIYLDTFDDSGAGVIYFAQACQLQGSGTIGPGYYTFNTKSSANANYHSKIDLLNLKGNGNKSLDSVTAQADIDKIKQANYVDYITNQHSKIFSGDATGIAPKSAAANWAPGGKLANVDPSNSPANQNIADPTHKDAYLYVNDASGWGNDPATYQAARINLQYVNVNPFTVPDGKSVTFTADNLSLNGQKTDVAQTDDKLVLQQGGASSKFIVSTVNGTGSVTITLPHALSVMDSAGNLIYSVNAGVYTVKSGTDLFVHSFSSGTTTVTLGQIIIKPGTLDPLFKKGKYTNE